MLQFAGKGTKQRRQIQQEMKKETKVSLFNPQNLRNSKLRGAYIYHNIWKPVFSSRFEFRISFRGKNFYIFIYRSQSLRPHCLSFSPRFLRVFSLEGFESILLPREKRFLIIETSFVEVQRQKSSNFEAFSL